MRVTRTYLELSASTDFRPPLPGALSAHLRRIASTDVAVWRALYAAVGARWHWHDRDAWSDETLMAHLLRPDVEAYAVELEPAHEVGRVGFLELCGHPDDGSVEIVYLGLVSAVFGQRLGGWLLGEAVSRSWALGATRVWLHTCTLDGEAALPNYLARGFRVTRTEEYEQAEQRETTAD